MILFPGTPSAKTTHARGEIPKHERDAASAASSSWTRREEVAGRTGWHRVLLARLQRLCLQTNGLQSPVGLVDRCRCCLKTPTQEQAPLFTLRSNGYSRLMTMSSVSPARGKGLSRSRTWSNVTEHQLFSPILQLPLDSSLYMRCTDRKRVIKLV